MNLFKKRIIEIAYKHKLSHLSSSLTCVDIIDEIYKVKKENEPFVLSCGQAGLGLYVVLESKYGFDAEKLYLKHGTHPNRDLLDKISCSTGSLGCGITIACGFALSDILRDVYCLISDGECYESSVFDSLNFIKEQKLYNLKIYCNINGQSAYKEINKNYLTLKLKAFYPEINIKYTDLNFTNNILNGIDAHYKVLTEKEYKNLCELI